MTQSRRKTPFFHRFCIAILMLAFWSVNPPPAAALMLGFDNITSNDAENAAIGESQLSVDVTNTGDGGVSFLFGNSGPDQSTITHIYFDSGETLDPSTLEIISASGVNFSLDEKAGEVSPENLPGGNSTDPKFETVFSVGADAPSPKNGVNLGESVTLRFSSLNFEALTDALNAGLVRVGIHVQNFVNGGSESFITTSTSDTPPPPQVDEPGSLLIFGAGIIGVAMLRRRRSPTSANSSP